MIRRTIEKNKGNFNKSLAKTMVICFAILNLSSGVTSYSEELPYGYNNFGEGYYNNQGREGTGTKEDPFIIYTAEDFDSIRDNPNAHYLLGDDINLSTIRGLKPIENFAGVLDGGGFSISNVYIDDNQNITASIFKDIKQSGVVKDVDIKNISIRSRDSAGGLAENNEGLIENVDIQGVVGSRNGTCGGVVVRNSGTIKNVLSRCKVFGMDNIGGIVFDNAKGIIEDSIFDGELYCQNGNRIGAIAVINNSWESQIKNCYWDVTTTGVFQGVANGSTAKGTIGIKYDKYVQVKKGEYQKQYITLIASDEDSRLIKGGMATNNNSVIRGLNSQKNNKRIEYTFNPNSVGEAQINYNIAVGSGTLKITIFIESKNENIEDETVYFPDANLKRAVNIALKQQVNDEISKYKLGKLESLNVVNQNISNLEGIQYCIGLKRLDLQDNKIKDISKLSNLTQLTALELNLNEIEDISPIANLTNLESFGINGNNVSDITPLQNLNKLEDLGLLMNNISDITPLKGKEKLTILYVSSNNIKDISPLKDSKELKYLYIDSNNISDISVLRDLKNLHYVSAQDQRITLENKNINGDLYIYKPIKFFGKNGVLTNISDNGQVDGNKSIKYRGLVGYGKGEFSISFEEEITTLKQNRTSSFTGKIIQPVTFTQEAIKKEDINKDGQVDIVDLARMSTKYNLKSVHEDFDPELDINKDNIIDIFDLSIVAKKID